MKVEIPDQLKADVPQSVWGKILNATPVVMAVIATMLAGLSSSEMTRAQYDRSSAAQQQSKAGDQWSFFQAKKLRGALQHNTFDIVQSAAEVHPFSPAALDQFIQQLPAQFAKATTDVLPLLESAPSQETLAALQRTQLPALNPGPALDPKLKAALGAIDNAKQDPLATALIVQVDDKTLNDALVAAKEQSQAVDAAIQPVSQAIDQIEKLFGQLMAAGASPAGASLNRDFTAARLRYTALRYDAEARLNQAIANLYEVQVRKSNYSAERHHIRSQRFFYGMLAAQLGVIIATFAIAARKRNLLWALAAAAGSAAVAFAIYVYVCV